MPNEEGFAAFFEGSAAAASAQTERPKVGDVVRGSVVQITQDTVFVDVGHAADARLERAEVTGDDGRVRVAVGDVVEARVVGFVDGEGAVLSWSVGRGHKVFLGDLDAARDAGLPVEGVVRQAVDRGLRVDVGGIRAFCPASQVDVTPGVDLTTLEGSTLTFLVLEVNVESARVILSRRALIEQERDVSQRRALDGLVVGTDLPGTVTRLAKFGAFVDIGGVEGLVHISELSRRRVERVEDVVSVGDSVTVRLLELGREQGKTRVRLSLKALDQQAPRGPLNSVVEGTVSRVLPAGVLVDTELGQGMVVTRELGLPPGGDHRRAFPEGTSVRVALVHRDAQSGRLSFSARKVAEIDERRNYESYAADGAPKMGSLGELLRKQLGLPEPKPEPPTPVVRADVESPPGGEPRPTLTRPSAAEPSRIESRVPAGQPRRGPAAASREYVAAEPPPAQVTRAPRSRSGTSEPLPRALPDGVVRRRRS